MAEMKPNPTQEEHDTQREPSILEMINESYA